MKQVHVILAVDENTGIAIQKDNINYIPWTIKEDIMYFKKITTDVEDKNKKNAIIMGKNTWTSINKPLPNRLNIVISNKINNSQDTDDIKFFKFPSHAMQYLNTLDYIEKIFICGGVMLYNEFINSNNVQYLYLTKICRNYNTNMKVDINFNNYKLISTTSSIVFDSQLKDHVLMNYEIYENNSFQYIVNNENLEEMQYINILKNILNTGNFRQTRNAKTLSLFGATMEFNLTNGFPLLTTKKMFLRGIFEELKFFLLGQTDTKILEQKGVNIWKGNTSRQFLDSVGLINLKEGDMGPLYSFQLRHYGADYNGCDDNYNNKGVDQLLNVINTLKNDKNSRRILMTTFNPAQINQAPLPPCHGIVIQFGIIDRNKLSLHMYQRSADWILGEPFNIASYALLLHLVCELVNNDEIYTGEHLIPWKLMISFGDIHVYESHIQVAKEQISRIPYKFPKLRIKKQIKNLDELKDLNFEDIELENYKCHNALRVEMIA